MDSICYESLCGRRRHVAYVQYVHIYICIHIVHVRGLVLITKWYP
jgi:hypothetical protein